MRFVLLREGTSDDGLVNIIRELLSRAGVSEVVGTPRDYKGTVRERIMQVLEERVSSTDDFRP